MAHPQTEKLVGSIVEQLSRHGVSEYLLVLRDPDSDYEICRHFGSVFWRMGVGVDILEQAKIERNEKTEDMET